MIVCPHSCGMVHATADIDEPYPAVRNLRNIRGRVCVHRRVSASGNTHYLICTSQATVLGLFMIRAQLRDDSVRWAMDWKRWSETHDTSYATGILFDVKDGHHAGEWENVA